MIRQSFASFVVAVCLSAVGHAANYDNIYWVGGSGEWTGDVNTSYDFSTVNPTPNGSPVYPEYTTGHWSTNPAAASGQNAKVTLGRNDGLYNVVGSGGYDLDRVPCPATGTCAGGTQLGTDVYISGPKTVFYNTNRQLLTDDDGLDRFGDFRMSRQGDIRTNAPGTPTLNLSGGAVWQQTSGVGSDVDGMWTRWSGAELNVDGAGTKFQRLADRANGFPGGAMMFQSFSDRYDGEISTMYLSNGGTIFNDGQFWFGQTGEISPGARMVMTINGGHLDLTGGDAHNNNNDLLELRADLVFDYDWKTGDPGNPQNAEYYAINFTGPGDITVDGNEASPLDPDARAILCGATTNCGGGIRIVERQPPLSDTYTGNDPTMAGYQVSYQDLWNRGILQARGKSGLTGDNFNDFFTVANNPGDTNYKLTSKLGDPGVCHKCKGDFNEDGKVDQADYVLYRKTLGSTTDLRADANQSLNVDTGDYPHWRDNFGSTVPGSGAVASTGVPEPGTLALMFMGVASLWALRRR